MPITTTGPGAIQNTPDGLKSVNPLGSEYAQQYGQNQSGHYKSAVASDIIDDSPRRFLDLQVMKSQFGVVDATGFDEDHWMEHLWARSPATVTAAAAVVNPVGVTVVTQNVVVTAASLNVFKVDRMVVYPQGTIGTVTAVNTGTSTLTISSQYGQGLEALAVGDYLQDGGVAGADGLERLQMTQRSEFIDIVNYVEILGSRNLTYNEYELAKIKRTGQTNKMEFDQRDAEQGLLTDQAIKIWLGRKGQSQMSNTEIFKNTGGITYQLQTGGAPFTTATTGNIWDELTASVYATDFCAAGLDRFVFGSPKAISALNLSSGKPELIRYKPDDMTRNLDLNAYVFGNRRIIPVEVPLFADPGSFPSLYQNRLFLLDPGNIKLVQMPGMPMTKQENYGPGTTLGVTYKSLRREFGGTAGVRVTNRPAHAVIDLAV